MEVLNERIESESPLFLSFFLICTGYFTSKKGHICYNSNFYIVRCILYFSPKYILAYTFN
jgi:hypothetical protein